MGCESNLQVRRRKPAEQQALQLCPEPCDERLFLQSVYYPLIKHLFAEMQPSVLYLTIDESSHGSDFTICSLNLITDATAIPLG